MAAADEPVEVLACVVLDELDELDEVDELLDVSLSVVLLELVDPWWR